MNKIGNYFRNTHNMRHWTRERGVPKAPVPGDTRWCSICDLLNWFNSYWGIIRIAPTIVSDNCPRQLSDNCPTVIVGFRDSCDVLIYRGISVHVEGGEVV